MDIKADYLPSGTYCCGANWSFDLSGLRQRYRSVTQEMGVSGCAGLQQWDRG